MMQLNKIGDLLGKIKGVNAMTDVTGFALLGHLVEMAEGSNLSAVVDFKNVPTIDEIDFYIQQKSIPGGTVRNWDSYGEKIGIITDYQKAVLADPQTSGGLLIAVAPNAVETVINLLRGNGLERFVTPIGYLTEKKETIISIQ